MEYYLSNYQLHLCNDECITDYQSCNGKCLENKVMDCSGKCDSPFSTTEYLCNDTCISIENSCDGICPFHNKKPNCNGKCEKTNIATKYLCDDSCVSINHSCNGVCKWPMLKCHNVDVCINYDEFCKGNLEVNLL